MKTLKIYEIVYDATGTGVNYKCLIEAYDSIEALEMLDPKYGIISLNEKPEYSHVIQYKKTLLIENEAT